MPRAHVPTFSAPLSGSLLPAPLTTCLPRRTLVAAALSAPLWPALAQTSLGASNAPQPLPGMVPKTLVFPRDLGSHPDFAIEWWYITGHLSAGAEVGAPKFGFQLTFFRSRVATTQGLRSAFAAKQLLFAHAAVTDVAGKKLLHDQRIARAGFGVAQVSELDTAVNLRDWSLVRAGGRYQAEVTGDEIQFSLTLTETQPLLLQGDQGLSRKGPDPAQASYYYSLPQLKAAGSLKIKGQALPVQGTAWLDHEWSQALMPPQAVGWDWIGMNLHDGSALTAFRLRDKAGQAVWAGGSFRPEPASGQAVARIFKADEVQFSALRRWKSPLSQADYPVEWTVRTPSGTYTVKAVLDNQELDSRSSTGAIYWEGLSELLDNQGQSVGRGYLEMTGYAQALQL